MIYLKKYNNRELISRNEIDILLRDYAGKALHFRKKTSPSDCLNAALLHAEIFKEGQFYPLNKVPSDQMWIPNNYTKIYALPTEVNRTTEPAINISYEKKVQREMAPFNEFIDKIPNIVDKAAFKAKLEMLAIKAVVAREEAIEGAEKVQEKAIEKIGDLNKELGRLNQEMNVLDHELKLIKAPLSVRQRIEFLECFITSGYEEWQTKQFTSAKEEVEFHEARWMYMLTHKTDDPLLKRVLQFIADNACRGMTKEIFAQRVAGFFHFTSNKFHVPALETYTAEELESELKEFFGASFDNFTVDIVCSLKNVNKDPTTTLKSTISNSTILP